MLKSTTRRGSILVAFACALCAVALASTAWADDIIKLKEELQDQKVQLGVLEKADTDLQSATADIQKAEFWISEAQAQLAKEEEDEAKRYMRRVTVALVMIKDVIETAKVAKLAFDRESAAIQMEKEALEAKTKLEETQLKKKRLQNEMSAGVKDPAKDPGGAPK